MTLCGFARLAVPALCLAVAGCAISRLGTESYTYRCARMMKEAFPGGGTITVTDAQSALDTAAPDITAMIARVKGVRQDVPAGGSIVRRDVAVECRFDNGVLTDFRWTLGPFR